MDFNYKFCMRNGQTCNRIRMAVAWPMYQSWRQCTV